MRFKGFLAAAIAAATVGFAAAPPAAAFNFDRPDQPRYHHVYRYDGVSDPYAYRYVPRGYYPYYNSGYWRRPFIVRNHYRLPKYYQAWGASKRGYHHVEWHRRHYGGHRRGNW